jgi:3-dehydroquinate dehydratase/shikimate dehydrogenase
MAEIVCSVFAEDPARVAREAARAAMAGADWIELRLDRWPRSAPLEPVIGAIELPVIATCRTRDDGGAYAGTLRDRVTLLEKALGAGAQAVDLEHWERWAPREGQLVIRSYHDWKGVPSDLEGIRDRLLDAGDVAKIACMVHDLADAAPLVDLLGGGDPDREPTVAFGIGAAAAATRVLGVALGAPYVYGCVAAGAETAPGQPPVDELAGVFGVRRLGRSSRILGVLGHPVGHSFGPWLHNRALRLAGVDGVYLPLDTMRPKEALQMLPARRLGGISVTAPHKEAALRLCHRLTPAAAAVGAVNTLTVEAHGVLVGDNTDVDGVVGALRRAGLEQVAPGEHAAVLGSGGAARAAAVALAKLGFRVTILARTLEPVRAFAERHGHRLAALRAQVLEDEPPRALVNATPVGSVHGPPGRLLPEWTPPAGTFVLDLVYRPRSTELLRAAAAGGAIPVSGFEMFLTQAAEQTARFLGQRIGEDTLRGFLAGGEDA